MPEFLTYSKYYNSEDAKEVTEQLEKSNIPFLLQNDNELLDKIYIGDSTDPMIVLKLYPDDFEKVNSLLKEDAKRHIKSLPADYYLLHFTNEELQNVANNIGDWNAFDQGLAEELLKNRKEEIVRIPENNIKERTYPPIEIQPIFLAMEYLMSALLLCAGIIIGLATIYAYKTLPNGKKVAMFSPAMIINGKVFIVMGVIRLLVFIFWIYTL